MAISFTDAVHIQNVDMLKMFELTHNCRYNKYEQLLEIVTISCKEKIIKGDVYRGRAV